MATKRKGKKTGKRAGGTRTSVKRSARAKRGIDARYPWKEEPNPYFELRTSEIQGTGAFAIRTIRKGTRITEYLGQRVSWRTADKRYDDENMSRHHTFLFTVDDKTVIDAAVNGNDARFIEAIKTIPAGTELVYDYQYERTDDHSAEDEKFYRCRCGSPKCRGTILAPVVTKE